MTKCTECGKEFIPKNHSYKTCSKVCRNERQRRIRDAAFKKYYAENREHRIQTVEAYRTKNPEKVKAWGQDSEKRRNGIPQKALIGAELACRNMRPIKTNTGALRSLFDTSNLRLGSWRAASWLNVVRLYSDMQKPVQLLTDASVSGFNSRPESVAAHPLPK